MTALGVGAALVAAAIIVPNALDRPDEPRLARPTAGVITPRDQLAEEALLPGLITGPDRAADLELPPALTDAATPVAGEDEIWRTGSATLTDAWWDAFPGATGWQPEAEVERADSAVHVEIVTPGAAHESNASNVVVGLLSAYALTGVQAQGRLLVGLDARSGELAWTAVLDGLPIACQVVGRGAHVACSSVQGYESSEAPTVVVLDAASGDTVAQFDTATCWPTQFLQVETRLYWAGTPALSQDTACLGGGREQLATIPGLMWLPEDALTLTTTGPLLRTPAGSALLTPNGWVGYAGWVEPGPFGVVVRELGAGAVDGLEDVRTVVSSYDGATLFSETGTAWRRFDLMPDAQAKPAMRELVGIGSGAYGIDGAQVVHLLSAAGTPAEPPQGSTGTAIATPTGVWLASADGGPAGHSWGYDRLFDAAGSPALASSEHPAMPIRALGDRTLAIDTSSGSSSTDYEDTGSSLVPVVGKNYSVTSGVIVDRDGATLTFTSKLLWGVSAASEEGESPDEFIGVGTGMSTPPVATVVGGTVVTVDAESVVGTG